MLGDGLYSRPTSFYLKHGTYQLLGQVWFISWPDLEEGICMHQNLPYSHTGFWSKDKFRKRRTYSIACGLTMKSFWINPSSSNFPCFSQTKIIGPCEMKLPEFFRSRKLKLFPWTFIHPFSRPFLWNTLGN